VKPRFQADNDLRSSIRVGALRREPSLDFASAAATQLDGVPDLDVLRSASDRGRILISHDGNSMPGHFAAFLNVGNHSPGVLMVPHQGAPVGGVIESIFLIRVASDAAEWIDRIAWLPI
jgi:hypothetical protein